MDIIVLSKGILIGAMVSFPVGPIGILCLRRLLTQGPIIGIISGLGAATADVIYAIIASLGLSFISAFLIQQSILIRLISSAFLCGLGTKIFLSQPPMPSKMVKQGIIPSYISTLFLTLTNPLTILSFLALFTALGINYATFDTSTMILLSTGVFIGSALWWLGLGALISQFHLKISYLTLQKINNLSGITIVCFGLVTLLSVLLSKSIY